MGKPPYDEEAVARAERLLNALVGTSTGADQTAARDEFFAVVDGLDRDESVKLVGALMQFAGFGIHALARIEVADDHELTVEDELDELELWNANRTWLDSAAEFVRESL